MCLMVVFLQTNVFVTRILVGCGNKTQERACAVGVRLVAHQASVHVISTPAQGAPSLAVPVWARCSERRAVRLRSLAALRCRFCRLSVDCASSVVCVAALSYQSAATVLFAAFLAEKVRSRSFSHGATRSCFRLRLPVLGNHSGAGSPTAVFADPSVPAPFDFALSLRLRGSENVHKRGAGACFGDFGQLQ